MKAKFNHSFEGFNQQISFSSRFLEYVVRQYDVSKFTKDTSGMTMAYNFRLILV